MNIDALDPNSPEWDDLGDLLGAYLHQDYDVVHGSPWSAIGAFRSENPTGAVSSASSAARRLAHEISDDDEGRRAVNKLGLDYYPPADGYTYRSWLLAVADFLETGA